MKRLFLSQDCTVVPYPKRWVSAPGIRSDMLSDWQIGGLYGFRAGFLKNRRASFLSLAKRIHGVLR